MRTEGTANLNPQKSPEATVIYLYCDKFMCWVVRIDCEACFVNDMRDGRTNHGSIAESLPQEIPLNPDSWVVSPVQNRANMETFEFR